MAIENNVPIRIALLDSFTLFRAGLRMLIENQPGMKLVGEAGDLKEALQIISLQKPDIILLELSDTGDLGLETIPRLISANGHVRIILMTLSADHDTYVQAVQNGVLGVVLKTQPPEVLLKAIRKVNAGEAWLDRSMVATVLTNITRNPRAIPTHPETEILAQLNQRERDIIQLIAQGLNTKEIASRLFICDSTVRHYLTAIYEKAEVSGRLELLIFAYHVGLNNLSTSVD